MKRFYLIGLVVIAASMAAEQSQGADPVYYSITMNDNTIGYATVQLQQGEYSGQSVDKLVSRTSLKVALLGKERKTRLDSETFLRPGTSTPIAFRLTNTTNDVVRHFDCEISAGIARTWAYGKGEERGEPKETKLPDGCALLSGNNFAHWGLFAQRAFESKTGTVSIPVFLPEADQVDTLEFVAAGEKELMLHGAKRACTVWQLKTAGIRMLADARTGQFVQLVLDGQNSSITLSDEQVVKLAEKARAEEVLAKHFVQSDVQFDDFLNVTSLQIVVDANLIGSGIANDAAVLTTAMQQFDGKKERAHVTGTITIDSAAYDGKIAPPLPYDGPNKADVAAWLQPEPLIESDDPEIVARSAELTRDSKDSWDATLRIARWVHHEISYTIADTPSARLALESRTGDCGPHATLSVAMLRAAGIPAKLVGGLLYTPTFGGSFGQHAWIEVYQGAAGWIPLDPTTGEFERISATHVKLFEGMGGVLPKTVAIVAFAPPNREPVAATPAKAKPLPWKLDKQFTFRYLQGETKLGEEKFTISKVKHAGHDAYQISDTIDLDVGGSKVKGTATLVVAPNARPISFHRDLDAAGNKVTIECTFAEDIVTEKITGTTNLTREIKLKPGDYCFDNNMMSTFVLICAQLDYEEGREIEVRAFHPSSLQIIPLKLKVKAPQKINIGGKSLKCFQCSVSPINNTFWITHDGRFVKAEQGPLVIELTEN